MTGRETLMSALLEKIKSKVAKVGVIGLGYVGLPLAVENKIHLLNKYYPPDSLHQEILTLLYG